jgi:MFS family permease
MGVVNMAYVGILLITILASFIVVRIGAFALQLTGIEADIARFQALSAFSGTGFTTTEAERVVRHRTRRRIVSILIILGNAGLVTIIATLVASFTQVSGYGWFFVRLAIILVGILVLYRLIIGSRFGNRILESFRRPLLRRITREAPAIEEIFHTGKGWGLSLVMIRGGSKNIGLSLADVRAEGDIEILAIDRADAYLTQPGSEEEIMEGDRLVVFGNTRSVKRLFG